MAIGKRLGNNDVGSPTKAGGNDWDEIYDFLNGVLLAGKSATFRTQIALYQGTVLKALDTAQGDGLCDIVGNVNMDQVTVGAPRVLAVPRPVKLYPGTGTNPILEARTDGVTALGGINRRVKLAETGLTTPRTFTFPDFDARLASITEIPAAPAVPDVDAFQSIRQDGVINGHTTVAANAGRGLLSSPTFTGTPVVNNDGNGGPHLSFNTGTVMNTLREVKSTTTIGVRQVNPEFFCKFALPEITSVKAFVGLTSLVSQVAASPNNIASAHGFGLSVDDAVSGFFRSTRNDGDSTTDFANTTTALTTSPISIWMKLYDDLAKVDYKIYTTNKGDPLQAPTATGSMTTELPAVSIGLYFHAAISNPLDTTDKDLDFWTAKVRVTGEYE